MRFATSFGDTPRRWLVRAGLASTAALALGGCTAIADESSDEARSTVATSTASPVPAPTTRAPFILQTPEAMAPERIAETNARQTGNPELDQVIDALFSGDQATLDALVRTQSAICHRKPLGLGDMEVCPEGVDDGTLVEFFPMGSCHGYPSYQVPYVNLLDPARVALFAVLALPEPETTYEFWPAGDHLLVYVYPELPPPYNGVAFFVEDGRLVRFQGDCNTVPDLLALGGESPDYLLEPFALPE